MSVFDERIFITDTLDVDLRPIDGEGNFVDSSDGEFDWDEQTVVEVNNEQWADAFDTTKFYKLDGVVARPVPQTYRINDDEYTFKKPRDELQKAQWRIDNAPWTMHHPHEKRVMSVDEVRGFWRGPWYDADADEQHASLYIPVTDEEAQEFAAENDSLSVGFTSKIESADEDGVDGYQTDIYYDHIASVDVGRCSKEQGCGLQTDKQDMMRATDVSHVDLGGTGGADDEQSISNNTTMCENDSPTFDVSDMNVDSIAERNDEVADLQSTVEELEAQIDSLEGEVSELEDQRDAAKEKASEFKDSLDEIQREKQMEERNEVVDELVDLTDRWDEEDLRDVEEGPSLETLTDRLDLVKELAGDETTDSGLGSGETTEDIETDAGAGETTGSEYIPDTA